MRCRFGQYFSIVFVIWCLPLFCFSQLDFRKLALEATPAHQSEIGLHAGYFFSRGDVTSKPGFGTGLHLRRALDYIFSVRLEGMYGILRGERFSRQNAYRTTWVSGSAHLLVNLNNIKWKEPKRRVNMYVFLGGGVEHFKADFDETSGGSLSRDAIDPKSP
ncbi:MAG: hypothetical protein AAF738_10785, partial [Bacteroidota bacterium]